MWLVVEGASGSEMFWNLHRGASCSHKGLRLLAVYPLTLTYVSAGTEHLWPS